MSARPIRKVNGVAVEILRIVPVIGTVGDISGRPSPVRFGQPLQQRAQQVADRGEVLVHSGVID